MESKNKKSQTDAEEVVDSFNDQEEKLSLPDLVRKLITAGVGAAFMTEEGIRSYLGQIKLPKDVLNLILQSANKSKEDLLERTANEISRILKKIDFVEEASKFVENHRFKIQAEIEVVKKNNGSSSES